MSKMESKTKQGASQKPGAFPAGNLKNNAKSENQRYTEDKRQEARVVHTNGSAGSDRE